MSPDYDRDRIVNCMFDPTTALILAELEDGSKQCSYLAAHASISEHDVLDRLSYLIETGFITKRDINTEVCNSTLTADLQKLSSIVEDVDNFDAAVDGLTKLDSYLN